MDDNTSKKLMDDIVYFTPYSVDIFQYDNPADIERYMKKFTRLNEKIKNIIFDYSSAEFIQDRLVPTFDLSNEQAKEATRIIRDVLITYLFIGDMGREISHRLNIDQSTADKMSAMIISDLFTPAIEDIKKEQNAAFMGRTGERPIAPKSPPRPAQFTIPNPAASLDVNRNNLLDLRNK